MAYRLNSDQSYCLIDGRPIFLDIRKDRYFRLPPALEQEFLDGVGPEPGTSAKADDSLGHRFLSGRASEDGPSLHAVAERPQRSAMELAAGYASIGTRTMLQVFALMAATSLQLRRRTLLQNIRAMEAYRQRRAGDALPCAGSGDIESQLCRHADAFRHARLYVPITMRCLPDSIALVRYLTARGLHARLVFGVMANPLSAHCWVQAGGLVLNDTVGNARAHTPIRVI